MQQISLNGKWFYKTDADEKLSYRIVREMFLSGKIKDIMRMPTNWQIAGLNNFSGAVWFVKELSAFGFQPSEEKLSILEFKGVDYFADVWLNEKYLGHHEGYFQSFYFDVSKILREQNLLIVKVTSPFEKPGTVWPLKKKLIKGIFNHHDCRPGGWDYQHGQDQNTGGIWNDVVLNIAGNVFIENVKVSSKINFTKNTARLKINCAYYSKLISSLKEKIKIEIISSSGKKYVKKFDALLKPRRNQLTFSFEIKNPELWWSRDLGEPSLYELKLSGEIFGGHQIKFGIREVKLDENQIFYLNGKRLFLRGTNVIPTQFLSNLSKEKIRKQVSLMHAANLNIVRIHAHVNRKEYYDECDRQGIIVWQDFSLQWTYDESKEFTRNAVRQIKEMVRLHYNHPSIAFWCCHNEPGRQIETLDKKLYEAVLSEDNTRIIRRASNYEEHAYDGWYLGNKEHYASAPMGPLVTEFGAQALPQLSSLKKFLPQKDLNPPNWKKWKYHNFQYEQTFQIAEIERGNSIQEFIKNSQEYQADVIGTAIDFYRRKRFNGINGVFQFMLIDCWPSITWSVVDYYFKKKRGYFELRRAFQPVYVSVRARQKKYFAGAKLNIDLWIINDLHSTFKNCLLDIFVDEKQIDQIKLETVKPDSIRFIDYESIKIELPSKMKTGKHKMELCLTTKSKHISTNNFTIEIQNKPNE